MFLGWYDPDKKRPAAHKLAEAVERYVEKFGKAPELCLASPVDAADLAGKTELPVRAVTFLTRHTYYVGAEEPVYVPTDQPVDRDDAPPKRRRRSRKTVRQDVGNTTSDTGPADGATSRSSRGRNRS